MKNPNVGKSATNDAFNACDDDDGDDDNSCHRKWKKINLAMAGAKVDNKSDENDDGDVKGDNKCNDNKGNNDYNNNDDGSNDDNCNENSGNDYVQ